MKTESLLSISQLSLITSTNNRTILSNISYQVYSGDFVVILGGNGSGKSSLLKIITQNYIPSVGSIQLEGKDLIKFSAKQRALDIAIVTQDASDSLFYGFTVMENCLMYDSIRNNHPVKISQSQESIFYKNYLSSFSIDLADKLDCKVENLSGGQRQTLALALCLRHHPKLLLLDEHTSALDPKTAYHVMESTYKIINKQTITCIMTTHDLDEALSYGNRLIALKNGQIIFVADADKKRLLTKNQLMEYCY